MRSHRTPLRMTLLRELNLRGERLYLQLPMTPVKVPYAIAVLSLLLSGSVAHAQPDSVDYQMWAREVRAHALRGFTLRTVELRDRNGRLDTISLHLYRYTLSQHGSHIFLDGNHALGGSGDSISVEL